MSNVGDVVELTNLRTNHSCVLDFDAIYGFTSDPGRETGDGVQCGFLVLLVQVEIGNGSQVRI